MSAQAGSMQEKAASDDSNDCADAGKSCNDARWTCIEQQNFVVEAARRALQRWNLLLQLRHRVRGAPENAPAFPAYQPSLAIRKPHRCGLLRARRKLRLYDEVISFAAGGTN